VRGTIEYQPLPKPKSPEEEEDDGDEEESSDRTREVDEIPGVRIVGMSGSLFFANASLLKDLITEGEIAYTEANKRWG